jgi:hypothetical protein
VPKLNFNTVKEFDTSKLKNSNQTDYQNVDIDPLKIRVLKNSNAPVVYPHYLKNYVNTANSNKKVFINIDHNTQDKVNNKLNK